ncbi:MAG: SpoIIE family protein phosphatase [Acidimicrobiales bacterium]
MSRPSAAEPVAGTTMAALLFEQAPAAIVGVDPTGVITHWSSHCRDVYGYLAEEAVGRSAFGLVIDPDDSPVAHQVLESVMAGGSWAGDFPIRRKDGTRATVAFRVSPVVGPDGPVGVVTVALDVTDRAAADEARRALLAAEQESRRRAEEAVGLLDAVLGAAPIGIALFDVELRYQRVNAALAAISGVPEADHVGRTMEEVVTVGPEVRADLLSVLRTGQPVLGRAVSAETPAAPGRVRHFNVNYYPVRTPAGELVGAGATVVDVTLATQTEVERNNLMVRAGAAQDRLTVLAQAGAALTATLDPVDMLDRLSRTVVPSVADWSVIQLIDATGALGQITVVHPDDEAARALRDTVATAGYDLDSDGPVPGVLRTGDVVLYATPEAVDAAMAANARTPDQLAHFRELHLGSALLVPLRARGRSLGVVGMARARNRPPLSLDDLTLATELAQRAGLAVDNASRYQHEHLVAENLQRAMLPGHLPQVAGLVVAARYLPATAGAQVGGDWYDLVALPSGTAAAVVGDVLGHDLGAAAAMGQLRAALRGYTIQSDSPAEWLVRLDELVTVFDMELATCVAVVCDPRQGTVRLANAGHPPPLACGPEGVRMLEGSQGAMLGTGAAPVAVDAMVELAPGTTLLLYTDGLVERPDRALGDGLAELVAVATRSSHQPEELCEAVLAAMLPRGADRADDVALLAVRIG